MVTRYSDLIDLAADQLERARARLRHPSGRADPELTVGHINYIARSLAYLGTTIGTNTAQQRTLLRRLTEDAPTERPSPGRGACPLLARAATTIGAAADLIASNGTLETKPTDQGLAWQYPRPSHLRSPEARASAWADIAGLTRIAAGIAPNVGDDGLAVRARAWNAAALSIPTSTPHPALDTASTHWALPLENVGEAGELDARIHEVTAIGWKLSQPPQYGAHPAALLTQVALLGSTVYRTAENTAPGYERPALADRDRLWRTIHRDLTALRTATTPTDDQRRALTRAIILIDSRKSPPDRSDLTAAQSAMDQVAEWMIPAVENMYCNKRAVIAGKLVSRELAGSSTHLAQAKLERASVEVLPGDFDSVTARLETAARAPRLLITPAPSTNVTQQARSNVIPLRAHAVVR